MKSSGISSYMADGDWVRRVMISFSYVYSAFKLKYSSTNAASRIDLGCF